MELLLLLGLVASWVVIVAAVVLIYQLLVQSGRLLLRLETMEQTLEQLDQIVVPSEDGAFEIEPYLGSLPVGVPAPSITLPDLNGVQHTLSEWRGRRVLLVFFDPDSLFCRNLLPWLTALASDVIPNRPVPVVITTGDLEKNRTLFDEAGFSSTVLLQEGMEVAAAFKVDGTPMSYLVEPDGIIGSEVAVGIQATLILAGDVASVMDVTGTEGALVTAPDANVTHLRDGLPEGVPAPVFRLPRLDGGELSLLEFRGRSVAVIFSDPECEPCDRLAPQLQMFHEERPELDIVMISRGEPDANRAKVAEFGFTFPVVLQRHWEVSREYGMLATPIAFLIDEWGVVAAKVAVGPEEILGLLAVASGKGDISAVSV